MIKASLALSLALSLLSLPLTKAQSAQANTASSDTPQQPNIIFILVDDLGYGDVGVLYQNQRPEQAPRLHTPHLDQMGNDGAILRGHYTAAPVCAPARASLLLGQHQGNADLRDNQFDNLLPGGPNLARLLSEHGYATAIVGKYGLAGGAKAVRFSADPHTPEWETYPTVIGFDTFFGYTTHVSGHTHYPKEGDQRTPVGQLFHNRENITDQADHSYTTDLFTAYAKHWIVQHQAEQPEQPFFLYLAYDTPHAITQVATQPYPEGLGVDGGIQYLGEPGHLINTARNPDGSPATNDSYIHPDYADQDWAQVIKKYASMVRRIDNGVGDLRATLSDLGISDNTLIVFTSDNGPSVESYIPRQPMRLNVLRSYGEFSGEKRDILEGGTRVGALAAWPQAIPAGIDSQDPNQTHDWMATFADAANIPLPARADGNTLMPLLRGDETQLNLTVYSEYQGGGRTPRYQDVAPQHRGSPRRQQQLIRQGDYVALRYNIRGADKPFALYNVIEDPDQSEDLAATHPQILAHLVAEAQRNHSPLPSARRPYDNSTIQALRHTPPTDTQTISWSIPTDTVARAYRAPLDQQQHSHHDSQNVPASTDSAQGVQRDGYIHVPEDGTYTFHLGEGNPAIVRLHSITVLERDPDHEQLQSAELTLQAGVHPITIYEHRQAGETSLVDVHIEDSEGNRSAVLAAE